MFNRTFFLFGLVLLLNGNPAQAIPVRMDFDVSFNQVAAPTDRVTGSIVWEAASVHESIESLIAIDLTIEDYVYELSEVGFVAFENGWESIGGEVSTVEGLSSFTEDFAIIWNRFTHTPSAFTYGTQETLPIWDGSFNQFSIKAAFAIPLPSSSWLLGVGLILMHAALRRMIFKSPNLTRGGHYRET